MELETIVLNKEQAKQQWQEYIEAEKTEKRTAVRNALREMRRALYYLKKGHKVLDLFETVKACGLNEDADPKLAIVNIEAPRCHFQKQTPGTGTYSRPSNGWRDRNFQRGANAIVLPDNTFPAWLTNQKQPATYNSVIQRQDLESPTPMVPAKYPAKGEHLFVMWEVEHWQPVAAKDPLLLRRITKNLFVIYGHWSTTKLERAIIRGRL